MEEVVPKLNALIAKSMVICLKIALNRKNKHPMVVVSPETLSKIEENLIMKVDGIKTKKKPNKMLVVLGIIKMIKIKEEVHQQTLVAGANRIMTEVLVPIEIINLKINLVRVEITSNLVGVRKLLQGMTLYQEVMTGEMMGQKMIILRPGLRGLKKIMEEAEEEAEAKVVVVEVKPATSVIEKAIWQENVLIKLMMKDQPAKEEMIGFALNVIRLVTLQENALIKVEDLEEEEEAEEAKMEVVEELALNAKEKVTLLKSAQMTLLREENDLLLRDKGEIITIMVEVLKDGKMKMILVEEDSFSNKRNKKLGVVGVTQVHGIMLLRIEMEIIKYQKVVVGEIIEDV